MNYIYQTLSMFQIFHMEIEKNQFADKNIWRTNMVIVLGTIQIETILRILN